jgi:hypothetical protein
MCELEVSVGLVFPRFVAAEAEFGTMMADFGPMMETKGATTYG